MTRPVHETQSDIRMLEGHDEPLVLDLAMFDGTAAFLEPDALASYLQTISDRSDGLRDMLRKPMALQNAAISIAEEAHTISGSAGMFGFERLAAAARAFEYAVHTSAPEVSALASCLDSAIAVSRGALQYRIDIITAGFAKASSGPSPSDLDHIATGQL